MPFQDFREFIEALRKNGELIEVNRPIDLSTDVGKTLQKSTSISGPAVQFNANGTDYPLIGGLYNSRKKTLIAFQSDEANIFQKILQGLANPIDPTLTDKAATHECILLENEVDLSQFPIPKYSPNDGGNYITPGIVVSENPETGCLDIGNETNNTDS